MHELSICQELVGRVARLAAQHASVVTRVYIGVGPLAGVEAEMLRHAYPLACVGTTVEGSDLAIEEIPLRVRCDACGEETSATLPRLVCATCGSARTSLASGDELMLMRVEMRTLEAVDV
jgi:hydrogenase nickel incorporation protein HypA/HybF